MRLTAVLLMTLFTGLAFAGNEVFDGIAEKMNAAIDGETGTFADGAYENLLEAHSMIAAADLTDPRELTALATINGVVTYNLACLEALQGNTDEALVWLEESVATGSVESEWMLQDDDLASLREEPAFTELVEAASANHVEASHDCGSCSGRANCGDAE